MEEKWREARSLQKFLYLVSPMSWRREHDHLNGAVRAEGASETSILSTSGSGDRRHSDQTEATQTSLQSHVQLDRAASLQEIIDTFIEVGATTAGPWPALSLPLILYNPTNTPALLRRPERATSPSCSSPSPNS